MSDQPITLGDRYQLHEVIGRGGMAEVWRATDTRLDREVAIKRLRIDLATDPTFQARFQREAQSAAGLNHPNIVSVYDTGAQIDPKTGVSLPYIVMELVRGHTLREVLRDGRKIVPEKALEFTTGVLDALGFSHRQGIVHRDIKPANVMLTPSGQVKVMDFGIARAVADTSATMTQTAAVIGTAQYLSPEQARGETVDFRSDIYSAGCLLYELLTGRPPFIGDSPVSVAYQHVREMPVPPSQLDAEITPAMDAIVMQALAKDPGDRYQSAKDMRDDITRLLNGDAVTAAVPAVAAPAVSKEATRVLPAEEVVPAKPARALPEPDPIPPVPVRTDAPKRRVSPATAILIVLLAALLGTITWVTYKLFQPPAEDPMVDVPRVIGYTQEAAVSQLTNSQLVAAVQQAEGPAATVGQVLSQTPDAGTQLPLGGTVTIVVNQGPHAGTIPANLVGQTEAEAKRLLREAGFTTPPNVQDAPAGTEPLNYVAGQVTAVSPQPGATANLTEEVVLYLATGKSQMPRLIGLDQAAATELAKTSGFPTVVVRQEPSTQPVGQVIDQIPEEGALWNRADRVTIVVAVEMPSTTVTLQPPTESPTTAPTSAAPTAPTSASAPASAGG